MIPDSSAQQSFLRKHKKRQQFIRLMRLAVFLVFALLVSALCFFAPQKNQNSRENTTEQQKTEDTAEQTEKEKREKYHFTNLEYIYYINSENETDFEEQAAEYVEKNYKMMYQAIQGQRHFIYN